MKVIPHPEFKDNKFISLEVDNQKVTGEITFLCSSDLSVRILSPYQNILAGSSHIPYFARGSVKLYTDSNGISEKGIATAEYLIKNLYLILKHVENNLQFCTEAYEVIEQCITEEYKDIEKLSNSDISIRKSKLRKKFKNKEINEKEYSKSLRILKKLNQEYFNCKFDINCEVREFLKQETGCCVDGFTADDLIKKYFKREEMD